LGSNIGCTTSNAEAVQQAARSPKVHKMSEELYVVAFDYNKNYAGRNQFGKIRTTIAGDGVLMTLSCAQALVDKFKSKYPGVKVVEILRNDRDELPAQSLAELGEIAGLDTLAEVVRKLVNDGFSRQDILATVNHAVNG
jgi:hypothetical protein